MLETETMTQVSRCPITQKEITVEYKNPDCGHVYEKSAIIQYCKNKPKKYLFIYFIKILNNIKILIVI